MPFGQIQYHAFNLSFRVPHVHQKANFYAIGDVIQLHRQFISFREASEFYNRPGRPIIMSASVCVGLRLIIAPLRIGVRIDAFFLQQFKLDDLPGTVHRFHGNIGFILVLTVVNVAPMADRASGGPLGVE